ncbi:MAG: RNA methyltransferase [Deferrisomatales bacterium]|nr:RNA methyltransferase [Deferrisomatales bacterium]
MGRAADAFPSGGSLCYPPAMERAKRILRAAVRPERWAKIEGVLHRRLGAVRVVVENLHHPHNTSAVLRTCEALGVQHVHAVETEEDFAFSRRITLGAHKWLSLHRHESFAECAAELRSLGFHLYAAMLDPAALPLEEVPVQEPVALVLGNEKRGVSPGARALCDGAYTIPMAGFAQSLNISVAAAVSLYSITRRVRDLRPDGGLLAPEERARLLESWLPKSVACGSRVLRAVRR